MQRLLSRFDMFTLNFKYLERKNPIGVDSCDHGGKENKNL